MSGSRSWLPALGIGMAIAGGVSVATAETDAPTPAIPEWSLSPSAELAGEAIGLAMDPTATAAGTALKP